jgi:uncharacterized membrane protein (UPF0127 family)
MGRLALAARAPSLVAALALLVFAAVAVAQPQKLEPLTIVSGSARHAFEVEVMREDADRAQGLMYRRSLAADRGMLFDFVRVEPVSMWMKNTYISLDMVFIRPDGTIARIAADTEPLSTRTISSGEPVNGVLEVAAGTAARLGIKPGDRVEHPMFRKR